jgi:hypothetical protein
VEVFSAIHYWILNPDAHTLTLPAEIWAVILCHEKFKLLFGISEKKRPLGRPRF